tara:strand:+ start:4751 stop:5662 length:912 start_codon:yes stop_codon:yes gene_type:complete
VKYLVFSLFFVFELKSQDTLIPVILLDDIVISEENNGFSVNDFIEYVKADTTFYMGFKHLRYYSHYFDSELLVNNSHGTIIGSINKKGKHHSNGKRAWITYDTIITRGKILKRNGDYKYYTLEAFDEVFFPKDSISVGLIISDVRSKQESQNMRDAKTIGFFIGTDNIERSNGGLSKKLAIFDTDMQKYYDYVIGETIYNNRDCYTFTIKVKDNLSRTSIDKTLVRNITSYFDKQNFNVIYRNYKFIYNSLPLKLDMNIVVEMDYINNKHLPLEIYYKGYWNVLFLKPEYAEFRLKNNYYNVK